MRFNAVLLLTATGAMAAAPLGAQARGRIEQRAPYAAGSRMFAFNDAPAVAIGVTTTSEAEARDTLGVLITSVRTGSPADKAGLQEGDRIESLNGVSLRLSPADIGDEEMAGIMGRRLVRELDKLHAGDAVDLRVYSDGHTKTVNVKTVDRDDLETAVRPFADRPALGMSVGTNGTARDTLGVFVMSVDDDGPAAKAGIQEGSRIASINGVDVRGRHDTAEDGMVFGASNVSRLQREIAKLTPGQDAELRVYYAGQYRTVHVKAVRAGDLHDRGRAFTIVNGGSMAPAMIMRGSMPEPRVMRFDLPAMGGRVEW